MKRLRGKKKSNFSIIKRRGSSLICKEYYVIKKDLMCTRYGLDTRERL